MNLYDHLMTWPLERLVKELQGQAKENAALRERVARLECELFWLKVPAAGLAPAGEDAARWAFMVECVADSGRAGPMGAYSAALHATHLDARESPGGRRAAFIRAVDEARAAVVLAEETPP